MLEITVADEGIETIEAWDREVEARRYALTGDMEKELWYDAAGIWVHMRQMARDGSIIEYRLMPEGGAAGAEEPAPSTQPTDALLPVKSRAGGRGIGSASTTSRPRAGAMSGCGARWSPSPTT